MSQHLAALQAQPAGGTGAVLLAGRIKIGAVSSPPPTALPLVGEDTPAKRRANLAMSIINGMAAVGGTLVGSGSGSVTSSHSRSMSAPPRSMVNV